MSWPRLHALAVMKIFYADRITVAAGGRPPRLAMIMNAAGSAKLKDYRPASPPKGLRSPVRAPDISESGCQI